MGDNRYFLGVSRETHELLRQLQTLRDSRPPQSDAPLKPVQATAPALVTSQCGECGAPDQKVGEKCEYCRCVVG